MFEISIETNELVLGAKFVVKSWSVGGILTDIFNQDIRRQIQMAVINPTRPTRLIVRPL